MSTAPAPSGSQAGDPERRRGSLSPELTRLSIAVARTLSAAARNWTLYSPEHPTVAKSVSRLADAVRESTAGAAFTLGATPSTLVVAGVSLPPDPPVVEAARLLHDRDLLELTFLGEPSVEALHALLVLLATPADDLRRAGGPAKAWEQSGHQTIVIQQIDYEKILEDRDVQVDRRHDEVWKSIVNAIVYGAGEFNEAQQERLLEISRNAYEIGELSNAVIAPKCNADGSPMITTQAATVLAVYRHLSGLVEVVEPERLPEVVRNMAAATMAIDPHVVLQMMQTDDPSGTNEVVQAIAGAFDDEKVAELLAAALARDGMASARLAQVFDTIAPDPQRKQRVLTMTRSLLSERDFGKSGQFRAVWASMEALLLGYDEKPFVSTAYQATLDGAGARAEAMAARGLPPELPEWIDTLGQDNVRSLSVLLITDLLRIEEHAERAGEIMHDMTALVDDLLLAGDFANVVLVLKELKQAGKGKVAPATARAALTSVGESLALRDAVSLIGTLDDTALTQLTEACTLIGPASVQALLPALQAERDSEPAFVRARDIVGQLGAGVVAPLTVLADDPRWFVQRNTAMLLGGTRSADAVPLLQSLLRRGDPRVLRQAVAALVGIDDPAAARAVGTVLRAARGESRAAVVDALVAERDLRVVPMLGRILAESDPFGDDHQTVLDALNAVATLGSDQAVPSVAELMRKKKWFARKKARAFKTAAVAALVALKSPRAQAALDEAARTGDRLLKGIVRQHVAQS